MSTARATCEPSILPASGEGFELGEKFALPGVIGGVDEDEGCAVRRVVADERDGGPAVELHDVFERGGEVGVDLREVAGDTHGVFGFRLAVDDAAGFLVLRCHFEKLVAKGGVGAGAVGGDECFVAAGEVNLPLGFVLRDGGDGNDGG